MEKLCRGRRGGGGGAGRSGRGSDARGRYRGGRDPARPGRDRARRRRPGRERGMTEVIRLQSGEAQVARKALERTISSSGGVVVFPADGLYGLACDPLDAGAIAKIHRLKGRDEGKPSAVMYFSPLALREIVSGLGPRTKAAVSALMPGPVTLVIANPQRRYPLACRQDPERLGVRLIGGALGGTMCPVFQTSANLSGDPAPARFEDLPQSI